MHRERCIEIKACRCSTCRLCGTEGEPIHERLHDRLYGVSGEWDLRMCPECGFVWLDPMPLPDEIGKTYKTYYTHDVSGVSRSLPRRLMRLAEDSHIQLTKGYELGINPLTGRLLAPLVYLHPSGRNAADCAVAYLPAPRRGTRFLDIGCGNGALADRMRELGWDAEGIDPDPLAAEAAGSRGVRVRIGDIRDAGYPAEHFGALCAKHVIEHVFDPPGFLQECRRVLRPGGKLVLITPNLESMGHRLFGHAWLHLDPPRHLCLWCRASLQRAVESQGLVCEGVFTSPRYANDAWSRSDEIRTRGRTDPGSRYGMMSRLRGIAFLVAERVSLMFNPAAGEELVLIAGKASSSREQ